jgi:UDP-glucose 4-epimerase
MKNILITGGAGYIGSHTVAYFGEAGYNLTIIDNLSTGNKDYVLFGDLEVIDLADLVAVENVFKSKQFDAVIHFAGSIVVPESVSEPLKYYDNNVVNSFNLIKLCQKYRVNKFIFSSTASTYGTTDSGVASELTPQAPINPYGRSKLITEWMLQDTSFANPDFKFVALRYFNVCGADGKGRIGQSFPNATHLIKVACQCASGKRDFVNIYGTDYNTPDGTCLRDYIHVDDLASPHLSAYKYLVDGGDSNFFNCGYGNGYSVKEVIATVKKISKRDFKVIEAPKRAGDPEQVISESKKIQKLTNWRPKYNDLEYIIKTAYEWELKTL